MDKTSLHLQCRGENLVFDRPLVGYQDEFLDLLEIAEILVITLYFTVVTLDDVGIVHHVVGGGELHFVAFAPAFQELKVGSDNRSGEFLVFTRFSLRYGF